MLRTPIPVTEFDRFVERPENADKLFEYIGGEIFEVPSNPYASKIAMLILRKIGNFLEENDLGHLTGEAGGYMVAGQRFAPDVAFISYARQPELVEHGYNPNPPDLAVEVLSDPNSAEEQSRLRRKLSAYLSAGVVVWVADYHAQTIEVHRLGQISQLIGIDGFVGGGDVLPGLRLPVKAIFKK